MINFTTIIPDLANDVQKMIDDLGFINRLNITKGVHKTYTIRISKNVPEFIKKLKLSKK